MDLIYVDGNSSMDNPWWMPQTKKRKVGEKLGLYDVDIRVSHYCRGVERSQKQCGSHPFDGPFRPHMENLVTTYCIVITQQQLWHEPRDSLGAITHESCLFFLSHAKAS